MNEIILELEQISPNEFFGPQNKNIELLKRYFPKLKIVARGNKITAFGDEDLLEEFDKRFLPSLDLNLSAPAFESVANLDRYLDKAVEAEQTLLISRPSPPEKTSISTRTILFIAIFLGGASGTVVILVRQAYRTRKQWLAGLGA